MKIARVDVADVRFPTSLGRHGSDAMNPDPDYSAAYVVMHYLRSVKLRGTQLAHAQFDTIRLRLLKIGTRVESGKTRLLLHLPKTFAELGAFTKAAWVDTG